MSGPVSEAAAGRNPAVTGAARWLDPNQALPVELRAIANVFANAAVEVLGAIPTDSPSLTLALTALTQAKDHAVRASILDIEARS